MKHSAVLLVCVAVLAGCESKPVDAPVEGGPSPAPVPAVEAAGAAAEDDTGTPVAARPVPPGPAVFRGLWVTRFDYRTPEDVKKAIADAATLGTTDIVWQVRGQADAYYASELEPWGRELFRDLPPGAASPRFDPLKTAVGAAHEAGMRLHAWVNVMPLWRGTTPPSDPKHPYNAHPEWRLYDEKGRAQALNDHYVIVNPVLDEVQDHIVEVCRDIATRYDVDGIHLDYVRFVSEKMEGGGALLPGDPRSLAMFRAATGRAGLGTSEDKAAFEAWKRSHITRIVHRIREEATSVRRGIALTVAAWRRPDTARDQYLQDSAMWLSEGSIDRAIPMIYTDKDEQFTGDLKAWMEAAPGKAITPGLGVYMHPLGQSARQLEAARSMLPGNGYCLCSSTALCETADPSQRKDDKSVLERANRRQSIIEHVFGAAASGG